MPKITLPTLHKGQQEAFWLPGRNKVIRCGRRWGKSVMGGVWVADGAAKGMRCGWFTPDYKIMKEAWREVHAILEPIIARSSENDKIMTTVTGGLIEFWTLENERAGRSRKYHRIVLDEIAFAKDNVEHIWDTAIQPTLLDYAGRCMALSTPKSDNPENFFYRLCKDPKMGFVEYHAPTWTNPHIPPAEIENYRRNKPPLVFQQEYAAEFVNWKTSAFFKLTDMLVEEKPVPMPVKVDYVFAVIDTAMKGGAGNDGTAVTYYAVNKSIPNAIPLFILDWDIIEMEGAMLEVWIPQVFKNLEEFARSTKSRYGVSGCYIEDKATGSILIQQGRQRGWPTIAIDSKLTSVGKDARAINASGYIYQGKAKLTEHAYDKTVMFREKERNHFLTQVFGFRLADPDANKREDDLLDCLCYGVAIALGSEDGF